MEVKNTITLLNKQTKALETFDMFTGELVSSSTELVPSFIYTVEMAQAICNLVREGHTLQEIAAMEGMPKLHAIYGWRSGHPDFKKALVEAKKDRAEYFHDKAVAALQSAEGAAKEEVPAAKLQFDGWLKLAEKGNPEEYNPKPQMLQGGAAPAMIVINTGINREPTTVEVINEERLCTNRETENTTESVVKEAEIGSGEVEESLGAEIRGS